LAPSTEEQTMTESTNPNPTDEPKADETFTWTKEDEAGQDARNTGGATATSLLDSVRDVVDDLAERAGPTVRELSAKAAELTAIAADRAAPLAKRAGEVTADASGKLASKSREWASELRTSVATADPSSEPGTTDAPAPAPNDEPAEGVRPSDDMGRV
jgi:hypothetical protein